MLRRGPLIGDRYLYLLQKRYVTGMKCCLFILHLGWGCSIMGSLTHSIKRLCIFGHQILSISHCVWCLETVDIAFARSHSHRRLGLHLGTGLRIVPTILVDLKQRIILAFRTVTLANLFNMSGTQ